MTVNSLSASAKLYLDTTELDFSKEVGQYARDITYPIERDNRNRKGKDWHVLTIDIDSVFGVFPIPTSSLMTVTVDNPFKDKYPKATISRLDRWRVNLADLYFYLYDSIDFKVVLMDESGDTVATLSSANDYKAVSSVQFPSAGDSHHDAFLYYNPSYSNSHVNVFDMPANYVSEYEGYRIS